MIFGERRLPPDDVSDGRRWLIRQHGTVLPALCCHLSTGQLRKCRRQPFERTLDVGRGRLWLGWTLLRRLFSRRFFPPLRLILWLNIITACFKFLVSNALLKSDRTPIISRCWYLMIARLEIVFGRLKAAANRCPISRGDFEGGVPVRRIRPHHQSGIYGVGKPTRFPFLWKTSTMPSKPIGCSADAGGFDNRNTTAKKMVAVEGCCRRFSSSSWHRWMTYLTTSILTPRRNAAVRLLSNAYFSNH